MKRLSWIGVALAALGACTSTTAGGGGGSGGLGKESFFAQYCEKLAPCCATAGLATNAAKCQAIYGAFTATGTYDAVAAQKCLTAMNGATLDKTTCSAAGLGLSAADAAICKSVVTATGSSGGTKKPGEPCASDGDCATDPDAKVICRSFFTSGATVKQCERFAHGKVGDACTTDYDPDASYTSYYASEVTATTAECWISEGLYCASSFATGTTIYTCKTAGDTGGACTYSSSNHACIKGNYCDNKTSKCMKFKAIGEACSASSECGSKTFCDATAKKCAAQLGAGAKCAKSEECESGSCTNSACVASGMGISGMSFVCGN